MIWMALFFAPWWAKVVRCRVGVLLVLFLPLIWNTKFIHKTVPMKNYLLLFLITALGSSTFAQVFVENTNINDRKVQYLEIWEKYNKDTDRFWAMIDYGQLDNREDKSGQALMMTSSSGQALEFNGIVNILNFMYSNGWEVLHVKTIGDYESFILNRRFPMDEKRLKETANSNDATGG